MMLNSTIADVLTNRQVEPTTQINAEKEVTNTETTSNSESSEAEVRLVVRFIVEEQIVYKGKIEKVHQLNSEELSRIVSRVAWDGAKEKDDSNLDTDTDSKTATTPDADPITDPSHPDVCTDSNNLTSTQTTDVHNTTKETNMDLVQEDTTRNNDSSNPEAYNNSNLNSEDVRQKIEENSDAQEEREPQIIESKGEGNCDNKSEQSSDYCDIEDQQLSDSPPTKQIFRHDGTEDAFIDVVIDNNDTEFNLDSNPTPDSLDDAYIESQSIADTLNDCVNNVDREHQQQRVKESNEKVLGINNKNLDRSQMESMSRTSEQSIEQNETFDTKENGEDTQKTEIIIVESTNSIENVQEEDQKPYPGILEECSHEEIVRSIDPQYDMKNLKSTDITTQEDASGSSMKRKATGQNQNSTGKRMRRTNPKERNLNTRTSASKMSENTTAKHPTASKLNSTSSLLPTNHQVRKVKVFAKWSDNHFYPGTILKPAKDRKYVIGFFDGAQRSVAETDLIPLCNIEGKQVRISIAKNYCVNAIVHDQRSPISDQPMFDVEYQQDGPVRKCVPLKDIFLTAEQGTPLINQADKNSSAGNFADVDLDNIIYEKRSRRFQEMEEFYFTSPQPHRTKTSLLL